MPMKLLMVMVVLVMQLAAQKVDPAAVLLEGAARKERVDGDLKGAIAEYRKIAQKFSKQPEVAAQALLKMGECQEKLGEAEARKSYERVVKEYAGAGSVVVQARARLAAMGGGGTAGAVSRMVVAQLPYWFTGSPNPTSADGRLLFFSMRDANEVWYPALLDLNSGQHKVLSKAPGYSYVDTGVLSADQSLLSYTAQPSPGRIDLIVANADGSNPRRLYQGNPEAVWFYPIGFSSDKRSIFITFNRKAAHPSPGYHLGSLDVASGTLKVLKEIPRGQLASASLSPDGKWIAYAVHQSEGSANHDIAVLASDLSSDVVIVSNAANDRSPVWTADGKGILFVSNRRGTNDVLLVPVLNGKPAGEQKLVRQDMGNIDLLGASTSGSLRYRLKAGSTVFLQSTLDESTGKFSSFRRLDEEFLGAKSQPKISPDSKQLAYLREPEHAKDRAILGVRDLASGKEREVFPSLRFVRSLTWMPDGRRMAVYGIDHKGKTGDFLVDMETGMTTGLPSDEDLGAYTKGGGNLLVSPDGKTLYHSAFKTESGAMFRKDLATGSTKLLFEGQGYVNFPRISPDGRWIIYSDNRGSEAKRMLRLVSTADGSIRDIGEGLYCQGFSADSQSIFVMNENDPQFKNRIATLYRMPLLGGEKVPVTGPLKGPDSLNVMGNTAIYRENTNHQEIWSLDNFMAGVK